MERTDSAVLRGVRTARATPGGGRVLPAPSVGGREAARRLAVVVLGVVAVQPRMVSVWRRDRGAP